MNTTKELKLCFKGDRDYLHGTDMFNAILSQLTEQNYPQISQIRFTIHQIVSSGLSICKDCDVDDAVAHLHFTSSNKAHEVYLINNHSEVDCRYEYDEAAIVEKTDLDIAKDRISITGLHGYSYVEVVVACYKYLLESKFSDVAGKWYFSRLDLLSTFPSEEQSIRITFSRNMNFRLVSGIIEVADQQIGKIFFTLK